MRATERALRDQIALLVEQLREARERIDTLEGREWHRYEAGDRPVVAMPEPGPDPHAGMRYITDDTGLVGEWVRDDDDLTS